MKLKDLINSWAAIKDSKTLRQEIVKFMDNETEFADKEEKDLYLTLKSENLPTSDPIQNKDAYLNYLKLALEFIKNLKKLPEQQEKIFYANYIKLSNDLLGFLYENPNCKKLLNAASDGSDFPFILYQISKNPILSKKESSIWSSSSENLSKDLQKIARLTMHLEAINLCKLTLGFKLEPIKTDTEITIEKLEKIVEECHFWEPRESKNDQDQVQIKI